MSKLQNLGASRPRTQSIVGKGTKRDCFPTYAHFVLFSQNVMSTDDLTSRVLQNNRMRGRVRSNRVGAASELIVCSNLLRQGWDVFRAVNSDSPFDLVAVRGKTILRVEVRTSLSAVGALTCDKRGEYDIIAIVRNQIVRYLPELPAF